MASASQIGKLELSKTGTHLNVVTAADLEGAEDGGPGDTGATPVSIGAALAQVKLAVSLIDDALCLPANPAEADGHVKAPELTDDPWNALPGAWNGGRRHRSKTPHSKKGFGSRKKGAGANPTQALPLKKLARGLGRSRSAMEIERDGIVADLAKRTSWHGMDEHGVRAGWVQPSQPQRGGDASNPNQHTMPRKDPIGEEWRKHLDEAKRVAMRKRRANLKKTESYQASVSQRPTGNKVTQDLANLMQTNKDEKKRLKAVRAPPSLPPHDCRRRHPPPPPPPLATAAVVHAGRRNDLPLLVAHSLTHSLTHPFDSLSPSADLADSSRTRRFVRTRRPPRPACFAIFSWLLNRRGSRG